MSTLIIIGIVVVALLITVAMFAFVKAGKRADEQLREFDRH